MVAMCIQGIYLRVPFKISWWTFKVSTPLMWICGKRRHPDADFVWIYLRVCVMFSSSNLPARQNPAVIVCQEMKNGNIFGQFDESGIHINPFGCIPNLGIGFLGIVIDAIAACRTP